jgi:hypothetical protein
MPIEERITPVTNKDLPDLGGGSDARIQADNLRAMQTIYFAALLEDLQVFRVVDTIVELFLRGTTSICNR